MSEIQVQTSEGIIVFQTAADQTPASPDQELVAIDTQPKSHRQAQAERTAYWGTCDGCLTTVVVAPHPDRTQDLTDPGEWENGFPSDCPVCDESMSWEGSDAVRDVLR